MTRRRFIIFFFVLLIIGITSFVVYSYKKPYSYPLKAVFYTWAGDTRVLDSHNELSEADQDELATLIQPGDILLNRSNYFVSNIGIPGFWTHAALYVGTPEEWTSEDLDLMIPCKDTVTSLLRFLQQKYPEHLNKVRQEQKCFIESVSEGVVLSDFKHAAGKDGLVVLRPLVHKQLKARAIATAFSMIGRSYDFDFNFETDSVIACTELVYRCYQTSDLFPVNELFYNPFTTANEIVEYCVINEGTINLKLEFVFLYDGRRSYKADNESGHDFFRKSYLETRF